MKPISIRFQCFGPYRKEMFVDFEELEKKGLFLICGETGAGKTTILDAMCYALYAKSSGGLRGDLSVMRCKLAEPSEETIVEFTFEAEGKCYRFVRSLRYGRKNLMDSHNCLVLKDGEFVPIFENPKLKNVNQKAEEIIGLNYEQFRQVIILPQGQFEKLLVSNSEEKEKILVSLFKAEKWQKIADEFYNRVAEEDKKLKEEMADIRSRISDYKCETIEELIAKMESYEEQMIAIEKKAQDAEVQVQKQKELYEKALVLNEQFMELAKRQKKVQELEKQKEAMKLLADKLDKADAAEALRPNYEKYKDSEVKCTAAQKKVDEAGKQVEEGLAKLQKVEAKIKAHEGGKEACEHAKKQVVQLENAKEIYAVLEERKIQVKASMHTFAAQKKQYEGAKEIFEKAHFAWLNSMEEQGKAMDDYTSAQRIYLSGISGILAGQLENGRPCPVCGSVEHPAPASVADVHVTEKELDELQKRMQSANEKVSAASKKRSLEEQKKEELFEAAKKAQEMYLIEKAAYEEALQQKLEGFDTTAELIEKLKELQQKIKKHEELGLVLQTSFNDTKVKVEAAKESQIHRVDELKIAEIAKAEAFREWNKALEQSLFSKEEEYEKHLMDGKEKTKQRSYVLTFHTELAAAKEALAEQRKNIGTENAPAMNELKKYLDEATANQKQAEKDRIIGQQYLEKMRQDAKNFSRRKEKHDLRRISVDKNLEFANRLRGRSGISLQRYVLGVMLSSIATEANRLLKNVHGGRYQLYRTDSISGSTRKGGLELEVLDTQSGEKRSVTTLSGGEKFLVALSLAIGLSTVVQAQGKGMKLGAMFIDEGFGSLDENSIYDALEVLQGIQKASGLVGIISHVELLREVIPGKIEVHKGKEGSWF